MGFKASTWQLSQHAEAGAVLDQALEELESGARSLLAECETSKEAFSLYWELIRYRQAWEIQNTTEPHKYSFIRVKRPSQNSRTGLWSIELTTPVKPAALRIV